mmetsp:Transcript_4748/g.14521  ORF Transcript_4748/g.14521 Transcript_4748/m.14521 type:complete len:203 (-) Transcript_4748:272-880(-)
MHPRAQSRPQLLWSQLCSCCTRSRSSCPRNRWCWHCDCTSKDLLEGGLPSSFKPKCLLQSRCVEPALQRQARALPCHLADGVEGLAGLHGEEERHVEVGEDLGDGHRGGLGVHLHASALLHLPALLLRVRQIHHEGQLASRDHVIMAEQVATLCVGLRRHVHAIRQHPKLELLAQQGAEVLRVQTLHQLGQVGQLQPLLICR